MRLRRPVRRHPPETIVALIDVSFFLLVFFLLIGRLDATAPFDVVPPLSRAGADMPGGGATVSVSAAGAVALDGRAVDRDALLERLAARIADAPDLLVRVNADRDAELRHVLPLVAGIEAAGARSVVLVVTPDPPSAGR
jgi:biopolymer transport protein ExbD